MQRPALLLTGSTGSIGEYLLGYLLLRGQHVAVLVRGKNRETAEERVRQLVERLEQSLSCRLPLPHCLVGDLHQTDLGLSQEDRRWVGDNVNRVLHNAGNVDFHGRTNSHPRLTNVDGTQRLVELCSAVDIVDFHYISTAYVCGNRSGVVRESELDAGQDFLSDYEQSKFEAEQLLRSVGFPKLTIYRPAAVVGDSRTGYTKAFHGIYLYVRFTQIAQNRAGAAAGQPWSHPVRLALRGNELHHLVPVDWVSDAIVRLVCDPRCHGRTYHLTSATPVTSQIYESAMSQLFKYEGVQFVGYDGLPPQEMNEIEELFYSHVEPRYWCGDPQFDCSNALEALMGLPCPQLDADALVRLFLYALECDFGRRQAVSKKAHSRPRYA